MTTKNPAVEALRVFAAECGGQTAASKKLRCSPQFVGQMLSGKRPVSESVLTKLGLRRTIIAAK